MLVPLCSGQRCQTLAQLGKEVTITNSECIFQIMGMLKTTRPGHVQDKLVLKAFNSNENICAVKYAKKCQTQG